MTQIDDNKYIRPEHIEICEDSYIKSYYKKILYFMEVFMKS